jgi:16S rRNA (cytosine967-C5)-methyltransferase
VPKLEGQSEEPGKAPRRAAGRWEGLAGLAARQLAVQVLRAILENKHTLDDAFARLALNRRFSALEDRDRAFARAIATVTLRRLGQTDDLLSRLLDRPLDKKAQETRLILAVGLTQLLFLGAAPYAVINLAVEQARRVKGESHLAGLVNAVLRRASREGPRLAGEQDEAALNTTRWLYCRWEAAYGKDKARRIAAAHLLEPPLDLSAKGDAELLAERLGGVEIAPHSVRLRAKGAIESLPLYGEGDWWVQDFAASLPVRLLGCVDGLRVADLCAAPGGKTAQLASAGAKVTAVDISRNRLARLAGNLARLKLKAEIVEADAASWQAPAPFDAVLLDAPCSATGTIRRNPDIPYLKSEADIAALAALQHRLLAHAATLVKPGGTLIYCTCSLEPEEGEAQAAAFLAAHPAFALAPIPRNPALAPFITREGFLRTFPFQMETQEGDGMDGFFAAAFRRQT